MKDPIGSTIDREARKQKRADQQLAGRSDEGKDGVPHLKKSRTRRAKYLNPHMGVEERYIHTPWLLLLPDRQYSGVDERLHHEIVAYVTYMQPTPQEQIARQNMFHLAQQVIMSTFPQGEVDIFGSCATGLCLPTSDIDLALSIPQPLPTTMEKALFKLSSSLKSRNIVSEIIVNHRARVPIVTFTTRPKYGLLKVDIGINNTDGLKGINIIRSYLSKMPALLPLVLVIKGFLIRQALNDASRSGLGSYGIICMCISFLQLNPGKRPQNFIDKPMETESLGGLLTDFMLYYGLNFPYTKSYISVTEGKLVSKGTASWSNGGDRLSIQCLINPENDVARSLSNLRPMRDAFNRAYSALLQLNMVDKNMLGPVISVNQKFMLH